jgi:archaellum component FlaF (FlaF/FlaG flagellin family)
MSCTDVVLDGEYVVKARKRNGICVPGSSVALSLSNP